MSARPGEPVGGWRGFLLITAGVSTLAAIVLFGDALSTPRLQTQASTSQSQSVVADRPAFDAASVKPNKSGDGRVMIAQLPGGRYRAVNLTLLALLNAAYQLKPHQLVTGAEWNGLLAQHFDIEATAEGNPSKNEMNLMLQSLLADRFKLMVHHETRQVPTYSLVLAKADRAGPQLRRHSDDTNCVDPAAAALLAPAVPGAIPPMFCGGSFLTKTAMGLRNMGNKTTIETFVNTLSGLVDRIVVDRTGLSGFFDFTLDFIPPGEIGPTTNGDPSGYPTLFTALQEQLGLKLDAQNGPVDVLVIDHVEQPSEN